MFKKVASVAFVASLLVAGVELASAKTIYSERFYQENTCPGLGGEMEVITPTRTRCDCLTPEFAVEYDFAHKWAEAIGQSLDYSSHLGVPPGIVLIVEDPEDAHYVDEILFINKKKNLGITLWVVDSDLNLKRVN